MRSLAFEHLKSIVFSGRLSYMVFFVTSRCNADCSFCLNRIFFSGTKIPGEKELSTEEIKKIALKIGRLPHLLITGGEPFIRDDLEKIAGYFYKYADTKQLTIPTNGYYSDKIGKTIRNILKNHKDLNLRVQLSIHGIEEINDMVSGLQKSFKNVYSSYKKLKRLQENHNNLYIVSMTVLTEHIKGHIKKLINFFKKHMIMDDHHIAVIRKGKTNSTLRCDFSDEIDAWGHFKEERDGFRTEKGFFDFMSKSVLEKSSSLIGKSLTNKKSFIDCLAGKKFAVLKEDGFVYPCELETGSFLGNIRGYDYDIRKLLNSDFSKKIVRKLNRNKCYCDWGCAMNINLINNPVYCLAVFRDAFTKFWSQNT